MNNYGLNFDEGIITENDSVIWVTRERTNLEHLVLTNKKLYCTYKKSNGIFRRATDEICELLLSDIKVNNGQAFVQQARHEGSWCLQIQFIQGTEYFEFIESPRKVIPEWVSAINNALGTIPLVTTATSSKKSARRSGLFGDVFGEAFSDVADSFREVVDTAAETFGIPIKSAGTPKNVSPSQSQFTYQQVAPQPQVTQNVDSGKSLFCINCGTKLALGAKFCPECGTKVGVDNTYPRESTPIENMQSRQNSTPTENKPPKHKETDSALKSSMSERQQEYVGKVYKCPNCGEVVNPSDTVCGCCGYHLSGKQATASVTDFQQKMLEIEMTRQDRKLGFWDQRETLNATDKQVISLIKSYPIPNSIDDIMEFFHLAIGNIDIEKSKKSFKNTDEWDGGSRERAISNAWVGKLQQIYGKAELYFPNEPEFKHIKEAYQETMKKLRLK